MRRLKKRKIIRDTIIDYINDNSKLYTILLFVLLIGLIIGIVFINNTNKESQEQISNYINGFINYTKTNYNISNLELFKKYIKSNLIISLILCFLGSTIIGMPLIFLVVLFKGYSIGYATSAIIATVGNFKGTLFILITMILPYFIYLPCILSESVSGIKLYRTITNDRRNINLKIEFIKHIIFCILMFIMMICTSILAILVYKFFMPILIKNM